MATIIRYEEAKRQTPEGEFTLTYVASKGWVERPFATNVFVATENETSSMLVSLAMNEQHIGFARAIEQARAIDGTRHALKVIEQMRHALCDHMSIPEHIHKAVIGNMGKLALAHGLRRVDLSQPDIMHQLHPMLEAYDAQTLQRRATIHHDILAQARQYEHLAT